MNLKKEIHRIELIPLTGVHIGTGNELSPFQYVIRTNNSGEPIMHRFSIENLISNLEKIKREELLTLIESNNLIALRKFFDANLDSKSILYSIPVTKTVEKRYRVKINSIENQLIISEMYRCIGEYFPPAIPGSSFKGAIRTALLDDRAKTIKDKLFNYKSSVFARKNKTRFEKEVFGYEDAKKDPLRTLIIRDCTIQGKSSQLVSEVCLFRKRRDGDYDFPGLKMVVELIRGIFLGGDSHGDTEILIDRNLSELTHREVKITIEGIIKSCNAFYKDLFELEWERFYLRADSSPEIRNSINAIAHHIRKIDGKSGEFLIRLGRYSQVEGVTVSEFRHPSSKRGYGKTRTLALTDSGLFPLGWVVVRFL
jgi:CRISPR-associated protein Csm5